MKELRLLQVVPSLESGGVEQGTIDLANYIGEKGCKSIVVSNGGRMLSHLNFKKVEHFKLSVHSKNPLIIYSNIRKLKKIILDNKINLIHVRSRAPSWSVRYASSNLCKSVSTFHNVYGHNNLFKRYYNKSLAKVDKIIAISEYVKNSILKIYKIKKEKITVIHRGIDTDLYNPEENDQIKNSTFFSNYNLPSDKKIILYPGRLTTWKGQIEFLNILQSLDLNNVICYFIGDDKNYNYRLRLEKEIFKRKLNFNCKIYGHISNEDMKLMYKCSDLIVSAPLQPEGFCRIISEGLAMKKIVLCYNYGGSKEQISGLNDFYGIEPLSKNQMIDKINIALNMSKNTKKNMGETARIHILRNFSKKNMLEKYFKFYQNINL